MNKTAFFSNCLTKWLLFGLIASLVNITNPANVYAENSPSIILEWRVPTEILNTVRTDLNVDSLQITADPNSLDETKGLPLLYIVTGAVLLPQLAKAILDVYKDYKYGPVTITQDASGKISITHDPKSSSRAVIFIDAKGNPTFQKDITNIDTNRWLALLTSAT